nr:ATP-binding protein [Novosphingobium sp. B1]
MDELADNLTARFASLARAHTLTMPDLAGDVVEQTETTLLALLDAILAAHQGINEERISIEGDNLPIGPHALTTIALLLHELATNAVKYGGLATPEGQLRIEVGIAGERMTMTWRETGARRMSGASQTRASAAA